MPLVYIAGPYTHPDPVTNTRAATEAGMRIFEFTGAGIVIPHLTLLAHAMFPRDIDYWYAFDLAQINHCTHLLRLAGPSTGSDREVEYAERLGLNIYYDTQEAIDGLRQSAAVIADDI